MANEMKEVKVLANRRDFMWCNKWSFEMTHAELIDACIELHDMWKESQDKLFKEYARI
jgi:hypothetical protein